MEARKHHQGAQRNSSARPKEVRKQHPKRRRRKRHNQKGRGEKAPPKRGGSSSTHPTRGRVGNGSTTPKKAVQQQYHTKEKRTQRPFEWFLTLHGVLSPSSLVGGVAFFHSLGGEMFLLVGRTELGFPCRRGKHNHSKEGRRQHHPR